MEYILILIAQLRILGLYTILPSGLTHNRPDQRTPHHTLRITTYQINETFADTTFTLILSATYLATTTTYFLHSMPLLHLLMPRRSEHSTAFATSFPLD